MNNFIEKKLKYLVDNSNNYPIGDGDHGQISPDLYTDNGIPYIRVQNLTFKGDINFEGITYISEETHKNNLKSKLVADDILIAKTGATVGKLCLLPKNFKEYNTTASVGKITLDKNKLLPKFLIYFFQSGFMQDLIKKISYQKSAQPGFNIDDLKEFKISCPDQCSQDLIVKYLNKKTSQIDSLIEKIEKKIELLNEQKTALINQYVTKGLDPNVEMKDSGFEWIGEIPKHWEITKLKYLSVIKVQYGLNIESDLYCETGVRLLRITDINNDGSLKKIGGVYLKKSNVPNEYILKKGDFLFSRTGATVGKSTLINSSPDLMSFAGYLVRFNFENFDLSIFVSFYSQSSAFWDWINLQITQSTIQNVNGEKYSNLNLPLPPNREIKEINYLLNNKFIIFNKLIKKLQKKLDLIREYRQSLITSVVTGKIRITEDMI